MPDSPDPSGPAMEPSPPPQPKTWKVGTLTYTKYGLVSIFVWTLWGDLVFTLSEAIYPAAMPFQLERLHIPQWCIPLLMGFLGQTVVRCR